MPPTLVLFFTTAAGAQPVTDYLRALPASDFAAVTADLAAVAANGIQAAGVVTRQIRGALWELKVKHHRLFFVLLTGPRLVLLHAYRKASVRAPEHEIDTAERRLRQLLASET